MFSPPRMIHARILTEETVASRHGRGRARHGRLKIIDERQTKAR